MRAEPVDRVKIAWTSERIDARCSTSNDLLQKSIEFKVYNLY